MTTAKWAITAVLVLATGVAVYSPVRDAYFRRRAATHVQQAEAMAVASQSPVARQVLSNAAASVQFALMRSGTPIGEIRQLDTRLVSTMDAMRRSPPPVRPVYTVASYDPTTHAGSVFHVTVSVHADMPDIFLVGIRAEVGLDSGWRSPPARRAINQKMIGQPVEATFDFEIPAEQSGRGWVRTAATYRLDASGEGMDLAAPPRDPLPSIMIEPRLK